MAHIYFLQVGEFPSKPNYSFIVDGGAAKEADLAEEGASREHFHVVDVSALSE